MSLIYPTCSLGFEGTTSLGLGGGLGLVSHDTELVKMVTYV